MSIKARVEQTVSDATNTLGRLAGVTVGTAERWLLALPRPFEAATDAELVELAKKCAVATSLFGICLKTGKALSFGLVDRRLNRTGKVTFIIGLATYASQGLLAAHELYVRHSERQDAKRHRAEMADAMLARLYGKLG